MELNKIPPHDIDAEQAVLGSMLTDKDAVNAAIETLKDDAFYRDDNRIIYQGIINLYSKSEPIDIITLNIIISVFFTIFFHHQLQCHQYKILLIALV